MDCYAGLVYNLRDDVIFAPSDIRHQFVANGLYEVDKVKEVAARFDNCPNAPEKISEKLIPMIDAHVKSVAAFMEPHLERELVERIKDKRMPKNHSAVSSSDRSSYTAMAKTILGDRKVKTMRFPHGWSSRREEVWRDNRKIYINEDWATIWAYTDPGPNGSTTIATSMSSTRTRTAAGSRGGPTTEPVLLPGACST